MIKKTGYFRTSKPRSKVPDTMLRCRFCGELNTDLKMTIVESGKTSAGNLFRIAHCKKCAAEYKKERRRKQKDDYQPIEDFINVDDFISMKTTPNPIHEIYTRLVDSIDL